MPSVNRQFSRPASDLPRPRSALVIATNAYADGQLAGLRSPASGVDDLISVLGNPEIGEARRRILILDCCLSGGSAGARAS